MRIIILSLLLGSVIPVAAQGDYAVPMKGDTLRGKIQILSYDRMDRIAIKTDGKKKNWTALEIRTVVLDSIPYAPVQYENTIRFMQVLKSGYLSLYGFKPEGSQSFDGRLLTKMNGSKLEVPNITFKRTLAEFLKDCEPVSEKVKNGDFDRDQLNDIIDAYNDCVKEQNKKASIALASSNPQTEAIYRLRAKVDGSELASKKDVLDLLTSMDAKARLKEPMPGYLTEGLKSYLAGKPEFEQELNELLKLLN